MEIDWTKGLLDQLGFQWDGMLRPRLDTLTDEAFHWEPVDSMWGIRRRVDARSRTPQGAGDVIMDFDLEPPSPTPMTTIAWRLGHIALVFGERAANHFGDGGVAYGTTAWPLDLAGMLGLVDHWHDRWVAGVAGLGAGGLARPCGLAEGPYASSPLADLVLHINREVLHHGAEVALMMDLFAHRSTLRGSR
jgi:DinB superfamily